MNYELIIPDTIWRDEDLRPLMNRDLSLPALATLYGKGQHQRCPIGPSATAADFLAQRLNYPSSSLTALALAQVYPEAQPGYWLCCDPIHLRIDRDRLTMLGVPLFQISQAEADALVAALNQQFADDGFFFVAVTPSRWYLRLPADPQLQFTPLGDALGGNMQDYLPQGEQALQFNAVLNEIQMLLYGHRVNDERDAAGIAMINSVWLWGGEQFPTAVAPPVSPKVWGGDHRVAALVGANWQSAPAVADLPAHDVTVVLDQLSIDAIYGRAYEWRCQWEWLEQHWFAPLLTQLQAGQLKSLTLTLPSAGTKVRVSRLDLYRFWRAPRLPF
ncbi:hypothetical protein [Deefgea piscis]|uniref:hypothetical protein n=1 Tax=Deefgea piscis TaxID=2739061 RepID=UPI001C816D4B|nr:hypothetical protein [Deefgea piscis]QZA79676.1 hypothetical protein K4H25_08870 [Deefgea piscis]